MLVFCYSCPSRAFLDQRIQFILPAKCTLLLITYAQPAKMFNSFNNAKQKLLQTNAAFWFNKICSNDVHLFCTIN